jgi:hypothetical protein
MKFCSKDGCRQLHVLCVECAKQEVQRQESAEREAKHRALRESGRPCAGGCGTVVKKSDWCGVCYKRFKQWLDNTTYDANTFSERDDRYVGGIQQKIFHSRLRDGFDMLGTEWRRPYSYKKTE